LNEFPSAFLYTLPGLSAAVRLHVSPSLNQKKHYIYSNIFCNMKKLFILISLSLIPLLANGQQNFASISFGTSVPMADYAGTGDLSKNGYAKLGAAIKFDAAYFPVSYLGIGATFSFGSNYAIRDSLMTDMIDYVIENSQSIIEIPDDAEITYGTGFWNYINLFLGPHFSVRPAQRLYLDFKALAGLSIIKPPDQELIIVFDNTQLHSRVSNTRLAFGYTAGAGLRFKLNDAIALKLGVDYFQSVARFDFEFDLFSTVAEEIEAVEAEYRVRTAEFTVGLAYSF